MAEAEAFLSTELIGASYHFLLAYEPESNLLGKKVQDSLLLLGYAVHPSTAPDQDAIHEAFVVVPIISEQYVTGEAAAVLRWTRQAKKVLQPVVHARDKTRIGDWIGNLPSFAGKLDWIDLTPDDDDYLECAVKKMLRSAKELGARPLAERYTGGLTVRPTAGASSSRDREGTNRGQPVMPRPQPSPTRPTP